MMLKGKKCKKPSGGGSSAPASSYLDSLYKIPRKAGINGAVGKSARYALVLAVRIPRHDYIWYRQKLNKPQYIVCLDVTAWPGIPFGVIGV